MYMTDKRKIFDWNHISNKLTKDQIIELKTYYHTYHRKCWCYKQAYKRFKRLKILGNSLSIVFASSGIASSIASGGVSLVAISTIALLLQGWMTHKNIDLKIHNTLYAFQSYQHLLNDIRNMMRTGDYNPSNIDNYVTDNGCIIDKFLLKYDKLFTSG